MSDVLKATYADLKTVKTRSTCQVILELPIEALTDVVALLGAPVPGNEVWVAIARLRPDTQPQKALEDQKRGTLAQQAGILCNDPAFRRYLAEAGDSRDFAMLDLDMAADAVRDHCGVNSRADLDRDETAAQRFRDLRADFKIWLQGAAA